MGNFVGLSYFNSNKEKYLDKYMSEKKELPNYLSYDSKLKQYFLQMKLDDNNMILYKDSVKDNKESYDRKLNTILLKNIKQKGVLIQNNVYLYDNMIYKFNTGNNINIIKDIYKLNLKHILLPNYIYFKKENNQYLEVYDYYKNGDLFQYLFESNVIMSFIDKINIFKRIVKIIIDFHKNDYTHRDIKCENILVDIDSNGDVQPILIDLDYSMKSYKYLHFHSGTAMYAAPELIKEKNSSYSFKSTDIWSLGILFYIVIYSEPLWYKPHKYDSNFNIYNSFTECNPDESYWRDIVILNNRKHDIPLSYDLKIQKVLDYCLNINYNLRTDVATILDILNE